MKPKINIDDPGVKLILSEVQNKSSVALDLPQVVESAVLPIYALIKSHHKLKNKPEQIASGVIVCIKDNYFIFSASHVFDSIGEYQLLIGTGDGSRLQSLGGDRFSSKKGESGSHKDDPIDASVFHIQTPISEALKKIAISLDDFDDSEFTRSGDIYMATGFRIKKSNTVGDKSYTKRECYPSGKIDETQYLDLKINPKVHIALAYDDQVLVDGKWQQSPSPRGFSGGAIMRALGITIFKNIENRMPRQLLTAIITEHRTGSRKTPSVLIGTRIGVHLGLIKKFLPDIVD